ncbi:activating transcription factor 7-interacting protein 2 isoform 2-T2 [Leptodactylus fuscus]|uniref:activating transcription factor 7-interacting protein 2 isoform X2 n=1 Tax=Leptodactylus fuscus TaxID=238119 RepID=UPI003F4E4F27
MEAATSNDEAPLMSSTNVKKKFRARKTMNASCRQQLATLKLNNSCKNDKSAKAAPSKTAEQPELLNEKSFGAQDNAAAKIGKGPGVFPNGLKVSIEVSQVDSGINIGCSYNETWDQISQKSEDVPFSHTAHFLVRDYNAPAENPITGLDQVTSTTNTGNPVLSEETLEIAESTLVQDVQGVGKQTDIECSTISENLNASITVKIIDEEKNFQTSSIDVPLTGLPDPNCAAALQVQLDTPSCPTDDSKALSSPSTVSAVPDSVQPENDTAVGASQKKRNCLYSSDVPEAKRAKTSNNVTLSEIESLIHTRINILFEDVFEQKMQALARQTELIRRNMNHTDDLARHLRSLRRLERRIKCAVILQKQLGTCSTNLTTSSTELHNTNAASSASSSILPAIETTGSLPGTSPAPNPTSSSADLVVLSDNESEQPSNPENRNNNPKKVDSAAMQKIMESIKEHRKKAQAGKTVKAVIDLTDDEEQRCDKDPNMVAEHSVSATSSEENGSVGNIFDKYSVKNNLASSNSNDAAPSDNVNEDKQSVPESPAPENLKESAAKLKTDLTGLKPPQKPQLRLAQVQNPKGIALSWNVSNVDSSCAPAKAYCLYVHQGDPNSPKKLWKKIGEIKALPLPMACTLTQFVENTTYSFAMRAKDANGRFGPLCDIQSTTLKPQSSSKKS